MNREIELQELTATMRAEREQIYAQMAEADRERSKQHGFIAHETAQLLHGVTDETARYDILAEAKARRSDVNFEHDCAIAMYKKQLAKLSKNYADSLKDINARWREEHNEKSQTQN
jgi:hypothetical protein